MYYDFLVKIPENTGKFQKTSVRMSLTSNTLTIENIFLKRNTTSLCALLSER